MPWETASKLKPPEFKRKRGFKFDTFQAMISVVNDFKSDKRSKDKRGNQSNFSTEDEILF